MSKYWYNFLSIFLIVVFSACSGMKNRETKTEVLVESTKSWDGDQLPKYPEGQPKITVLKITIPPKYTLKPHLHPVINTGILTKGRLTVVDAKGNTLKLKKGDALVELVNTVHYGKNETSRPAEILVFYAGTTDSPITVIKK